MSTPDPATASTSPPSGAAAEALDEYRNAAAGVRATARAIAAAFAAIPALGVVAALIKGPGSAGWHPALLVIGVVVAAAGTILGIYIFADVQRPGDLTDANVGSIAMGELPEAHGFKKFEQLRTALEAARSRVAQATMTASDTQGYADADDAKAKSARKVLTALVASAGVQGDTDFEGTVATARDEVINTAAAAAASDATAAIAKRAVDAETIPFTAFEELRQAAYGLKLSAILNERLDRALRWGAGAFLLVAVGVVLVAVAPKDTSSANTTASPSLLVLTLDNAGIKKLGCSVASSAGGKVVVEALKTGGSTSRPHVITLPSKQCPTPGELDFTTGSTYGSAKPAP